MRDYNNYSMIILYVKRPVAAEWSTAESDSVLSQTLLEWTMHMEADCNYSISYSNTTNWQNRNIISPLKLC